MAITTFYLVLEDPNLGSFMACGFFFNPCERDFGDAPDGLPTGYAQIPNGLTGIIPAEIGNFPTLRENNGARVAVVDKVWLGETPGSREIDAIDPNDPDGKPNLQDPMSNLDSDDHITSGPCLPGNFCPVVVVRSSESRILYVNVLVDINLDGRWGGNDNSQGDSEWVIKNELVNIQSSSPISIVPFPNLVNIENVWTRIVVSDQKIDSSDWDGTGLFTVGEVEDHFINFSSSDPPEIPGGDIPGRCGLIEC